MSSSETPVHYKKTYDDISFQKRRKLIYLINEEKWTIKAAAQEIGIKLCTAKYILYLYRKEGKIYKKKGESPPTSSEDTNSSTSSNIVYVPFPVYIFCYYAPEQMPTNLVHAQSA